MAVYGVCDIIDHYTHAYCELINYSSINDIPAKARRLWCKLSEKNTKSYSISAKQVSSGIK